MLFLSLGLSLTGTAQINEEDARKIWHMHETIQACDSTHAVKDSIITSLNEVVEIKSGTVFKLKEQLIDQTAKSDKFVRIIANKNEEISLQDKVIKKEAMKKNLYKGGGALIAAFLIFSVITPL